MCTCIPKHAHTNTIICTHTGKDLFPQRGAGRDQGHVGPIEDHACQGHDQGEPQLPILADQPPDHPRASQTTFGFLGFRFLKQPLFN